MMATITVRWLKFPRLAFFGDFGAVATESTIRGALAAFAELNEILGFEREIKKSQRRTQPEFLGVTVRIAIV